MNETIDIPRLFRDLMSGNFSRENIGSLVRTVFAVLGLASTILLVAGTIAVDRRSDAGEVVAARDANRPYDLPAGVADVINGYSPDPEIESLITRRSGLNDAVDDQINYWRAHAVPPATQLSVGRDNPNSELRWMAKDQARYYAMTDRATKLFPDSHFLTVKVPYRSDADNPVSTNLYWLNEAVRYSRSWIGYIQETDGRGLYFNSVATHVAYGRNYLYYVIMFQ